MWTKPEARSATSHVAIALICAGCGASDRSESTGASRADSAGVQIVRNTDDPLPRWELVQPARRVFGSEEEGPELFGMVTARLHPNGSLWIEEQQSREIRVFDSRSGAHLFTIGGRGDGPGEFRRRRLLGFDAAGTAYVQDDEHRRLSVFSEGGELLRSHLLPSSLGIAPRPLHVTRAGTLMGQLPRGLEQVPADGSTIRDTVRVWAIQLDDAAPTLVSKSPGALWYFRDGNRVGVPYAGGSRTGFWNDRVYVTDGTGTASYSVYGPAGLERRVEIERAPRRLDGSSATMFVESMRRWRASESLVRTYEEHLDDMPMPEVQRHWDALLVFDDGGAWLLRAADPEGALAEVPPDHIWDVFDADGVFIGQMRLPANVGLVQVSGQNALTSVVDELGRVTVAIHEVRWIG